MNTNTKYLKKTLPWWYRAAPVICQGITWHIGKTFIRLTNELKITGKKNLKTAIKLRKSEGSGVIFVAKHTGELDPLLVLTAINPFSPLFPMFYLSQDGNHYKAKRFGWRRFFYGRLLFYLWGAHPVISADGSYSILNEEANHDEALARHKEILYKKNSLCVFPEGKIPKNGELGEVNGGLGPLVNTKAVIVPVSIKRKIGSKKQQIKVHYGSPLTYSNDIVRYKNEYGNNINANKKISERIMKKVKENIETL